MGFFHLTDKGSIDPVVEIANNNRREAAAALRRYAIPMTPGDTTRYCLFAIIDTLFKRGIDVQEVLIDCLNEDHRKEQEQLTAKASSDGVSYESTRVDLANNMSSTSDFAPTYDENGFYCG